jgi:integrase/recombinase XerD
MSDPQTNRQLPAPTTPAEQLLTAAAFHRLAEVPPEIEWFANIRNRSTRRAYENAIRDFMRFTGIVRPEDNLFVGLRPEAPKAGSNGD